MPAFEHPLHFHIVNQYIENRAGFTPYQRWSGQSPATIDNQAIGIRIGYFHDR
jgi:hypothetical protein